MNVEAVETVMRWLNEAQVRYLVVGGIAVNAHGYVRATKDIDLVIKLDPDNVERAFQALRKAGYRPSQPVTPQEFAVPALRKLWREEKQMIVLKMWSDAFPRTPIDIFIEEPFDFKVEYVRARLETLAPDVRVPVVALGTLFKMKESAGRPQDLSDVAELRQLHNL